VTKKKNPGKNSIVENQSASLQQSRSLACEMAQLAFDSHCRDVKVLELARLSPVANHFVIATGTSSQQIRSVARELEDLGKDKNFSVFGRSGIEQGRWAVVDFVDVVVHLFDEEFRQYYDLELLWGDAPKINWRRRKNFATEPIENIDEKD
jgi:ribosome-associated protein